MKLNQRIFIGFFCLFSIIGEIILFSLIIYGQPSHSILTVIVSISKILPIISLGIYSIIVYKTLYKKEDLTKTGKIFFIIFVMFAAIIIPVVTSKNNNKIIEIIEESISLDSYWRLPLFIIATHHSAKPI